MTSRDATGSTDSYTWPYVLGKVTDRIDLTVDEASWAMREIMSDGATGAQIAAFGVGVKMKGASSAELRGLSEAMLALANRVHLDEPAIDIVGTGGDRSHTVNISTMTSVVVAAAGVRVVKHGNRAASSKSGGADVLEALGVAINLNPSAVEQSIAETGIGFASRRCFTRPSVSPVRRAVRSASRPCSTCSVR